MRSGHSFSMLRATPSRRCFLPATASQPLPRWSQSLRWASPRPQLHRAPHPKFHDRLRLQRPQPTIPPASVFREVSSRACCRAAGAVSKTSGTNGRVNQTTRMSSALGGGIKMPWFSRRRKYPADTHSLSDAQTRPPSPRRATGSHPTRTRAGPLFSTRSHPEYAGRCR